MAKIFDSDNVLIPQVMHDFLNTWPKKPVDEILLEDVGRKVPSMSLQQLAAAQIVKQYINGNYIAAWNFAVYIAVDGEDTASRVGAAGCLQELGGWLSAKDAQGRYMNLPVIDGARTATKIEMTSTPTLAQRQDNGVEVYQALYRLEYYANRR